MIYSQLVGEVINGIIITEKHVQMAENTVCKKTRKRLKTAGDPDSSKDNVWLLTYRLTVDDVKRSIPSIVSLAARNEARAKGELPPPSKEIKFDDIRNMSLGLDNLEGYTEAEKHFVQQRLCVYEKDFDIEKPNDKFLARRVVLCELMILQLERYRLELEKHGKKQAEISDVQKQIESLEKQFTGHCDKLNVLKKQRDNPGKGKGKEEAGNNLTETISKLDKPVSDLEAEVIKEKQQEVKMIAKRNKRVDIEADED